MIERGRCHGQRGQVIVWTVVMLPLFLAVIGLVIDGGILFDARRELQNVADAAARAGAMQIDQRAYRESSGTTVVLDLPSARQVAAEYASWQGSGIATTIAVDPRRVVVRSSRQVPTSFLRLVGIETVSVAATAPAEVRYGIEQGSH